MSRGGNRTFPIAPSGIVAYLVAMKRILSLFLAIGLMAASCTKDSDDQPSMATQNACQNVSTDIQAESYIRIVTLVIDLNCQAVGHLDVEVPAGATKATGCYPGPCKAGAVRLGSIHRK